MKWTPERVEELKTHWANPDATFRTVAHAMGTTVGSIDGKCRTLGLQFHRKKNPAALLPDHAAVAEARTVYPASVREPDGNVLKSGDNQRKIGKKVTKGAWKGFPIFVLTLEERATCPRSCQQYLACYGNNMRFAARYKHGPALEASLRTELKHLQKRFPKGFVVRLHLLGDFPTLGYVRFWEEMLNEFPALHVFGYTAWLQNTRIGQAIADLRSRRWMRFAVRTSGAMTGPRTVVVAKEWPTIKAIVCPAQTGKTKSCSSCGLCWSLAARDKAIAFLAH